MINESLCKQYLHFMGMGNMRKVENCTSKPFFYLPIHAYMQYLIELNTGNYHLPQRQSFGGSHYLRRF